jgi:hypothetical protein
MKTSKENGAGRTNKGQTPRRLVVLLIHPTNYDHRKNQGIGAFAQTYRLGVIPSNTLRVMESLTRQAFREGPFTAIETEVHSFEDSIRGQQKAFRRMLERFPEQGTRLVVGFVAVQSNQFPRACDLMREAKAHGATCVIGGPHITATINASLHGISTIDPMRPGVVSPHRMPVEIQELIDEPGVVVFHGDADNEGAWSKVLKDVLAGSAKDFYEGGLAGQLEGPAASIQRHSSTISFHRWRRSIPSAAARSSASSARRSRRTGGVSVAASHAGSSIGCGASARPTASP